MVTFCKEEREIRKQASVYSFVQEKKPRNNKPETSEIG